MKRIIILLFILSYSFQSSAMDQDYKKKLMSRAPGLTSKTVSKRLQRATSLMSKGSYDKAIAILSKLTEGKRRAFESAKVWQTLAYAYAQSEKYPKARNAFAKVLKVDALPYGPTLQSYFALAQLQMMASQYDKALATIEGWFFLTNEDKPEAYVFKASILYEKGNKDQALKLVLKALSLTKHPKENWLVFAVSLLYTKERYKEAGEYLHRLVDMKPGKKAYWSQLAGALLNNDKSKHALAVLELALMMNLLDKEGEVKNIVSLYIQNEMPFEAATLMEKAFANKIIKKDVKNLELLANSLVQAKEYDRAMAPLAQAAKMSKDGKLYALQGRLFLEKEQFNKAVSSFNKAIQKGVKKKEQGRILIESAIANIQMEKFDTAQTLLSKAAKFKDQKKAAGNWQSYLASMQ